VNQFSALKTRQGAGITHGAAASHGQSIGHRIATSVLSSRAGDGWPVALARSNPLNGSRAARGRTVKPVPFILKRPDQFAPELPFFEYGDGMIIPNRRLLNKTLIGTPAAAELSAETVMPWRTEVVARWNRAAHSLALRTSQDLTARAQLFAALNTTLADALLSSTYWSLFYMQDCGRVSSQGTFALHDAMKAGDAPPDPSRLSWIISALSGFPATPAVLAGAAETILRRSLDHRVLVDLQLLARQCAWAALVTGESTSEGCVAGYELGSRIAKHALQQDRR
jgi:hypothetical protein